MNLTETAKPVSRLQQSRRGNPARKSRGRGNPAAPPFPKHKNYALAILIGQIIYPSFSSPAAAQTSIPAGTDIGTYLNGSTAGTPNWSATSNSFQITSDATWNSAVYVNSAAHSSLSIDGNGYTVTRAGNNVILYTAGINQDSITLSNLTFGSTASSTQPIFYNISGTRTSNLFLNNVTFDGLTGGIGNVFYMVGTTGSTVMNVTAGTDNNKATFRNNVSVGDGAGVLAMHAGTMNMYGEYLFDSNSTANYGGAIAMYQNDGVLTFHGRTTFTNNFATYNFGGAIDIWGGASTLTFNDVATFTGNHVNSASTSTNNPRGGAINIGYTSPGSGASVVRFNGPVTFDGNYVVSTGTGGTAYGGAISAYGNGNSYRYQYLFGGPAIFQNNFVAKTGSGAGSAHGGAIYYDASGALLSLSSGTQFINNYATGNGGAIYLQSGTISLNAATDNILFQGNLSGVQVDAFYRPVAGTGTPNGIYLGSSGTLNLNANEGYQIQLRDPISSVAGSTVTVNKSGAGDIIFYGDNGTSTAHDSNITANTTVQGGNFILADGVNYGNTSSGTFTVTTGSGTSGRLVGNDKTSLRALNLSVQNGGQILINNGLFTLDATNISFMNGSQLNGSGTLAATGNINLAGTVTANIDAGNTLNMSGLLAGTGGISLQGGGTLALSNSGNSYTGATNIASGSTLVGTVANAFGSSGNVAVDGTLDMGRNNLNQTAQGLSGAGSILLGSATLTASGGTNTAYSGSISGTGSLTKSGTGTLTLSGTSNNYSGGTLISAGTLNTTNSGAIGAGAITNNGTLQLDYAAADTLTNRISGTGTLLKTGAGTATVNAVDSSAGNVSVNGGTLYFDQNGAFTVANNLTTGSNATTTLGSNAQLQIGQTFTQASGSTLNVDVGTSNSPLITADSASVSGALNVVGFSSRPPNSASALANTQYTILHTTNGISGTFSAVDLSGASSAADYLTLSASRSADNRDYNVGFGLTWQAGTTLGNGVFTLTAPSDTFNVDVALSNQAGSATGWNGRTLTKNGAGTLTLSAENTYTGQTTVNAGTLATGIANAFTSSSAVSIASGANLALNNFSQTANNLSGAGNVSLGQLDTTALTAHNTSNTAFSGVIGGAGQLSKTGTGTLTLSGANTYAGGTTISGGRLVATSGSALGTGGVANASALQLEFASDGTLANTLSGTGSLTKTGAGVATLSAVGTQGAVAVNAGTLRFGQAGIFNANSLATASGATTAIGNNAQLAIANALTQASDSALSVAVSVSNNPAITAGSATLAGTLNITGYTVAAPASASTLTGTQFTVLHTTGGITGDFATVNLGGASSAVDYLTLAGRKSANNLDYNVGFGLTWQAGTTLGNGVFTLTNAADRFNVDVVLADEAASATGWNGKDLTKNGAGTLTLSAANTYTGLTTVSAGTLAAGIADAFASSSAVSVASGATLAMNDFNQTANNLSGAGTVTLGTRSATVLTAHNSSDTAFSGVIGGAGQLGKTGTGTLTLSGTSTFTGGTTISAGKLVATNGNAVGTGAVANNAALQLDFASDSTLANTLSGTGSLTKTGTGAATLSGTNTYAGGTTLSAGTLVATQGSALGTGAIANAAALRLDFASDSTLANTLSGTGSLTKTGAGVATLSTPGTQGAVAVDVGTLRFGQTGVFNASSLTTANGATTAIDDHAQLNVANAFTQANGSQLSVALGASNNPVITAGSAALAGTLNITGFSATAPGTASALPSTLFTVLRTTGGIAGDFTTVNLGGASSTVDYLTLAGRKSADNLNYNVGFGLTWQAGTTLGNGVFTLTNAADRFNVDVVLADEGASATGWNGKDLTKAGDGTLTLSAANTYTGLTTVNAGTLAAGIANAFASSSAVSIASGATLAMNDFSQTANNLSGAGNIGTGTLSATTLTANNTSDTAFSGVIGGAGQLAKTGTGTLTLSGTNTYAGGTTLSGGRLVATGGSALGTGAIANAAALQLDFASDSTLANVLSGTGSLTKTGTGVATLTAVGAQGAVAVNAGTLRFGQTGTFAADSLTTANNATTAVDANAQLNVANAFTQANGSTLSVALGASNNPVITANSATLAGTLNITGFSATAPATASALPNTLFTVLHTTTGITGDFTTVNLGGAASTVDYLTLAGRKSADNLNYNVGFGLTWQAGATLGNGVFTLANTADRFNVDVVLADEAASATGWNGRDLTKAGDGTLTLSARNTYTGLTTVSAGTLAAATANAFASSSAVSVASGATLALNDFSQTANNLSGAGTVSLGTLSATTLTANNTSDTAFSGVIGGAGKLSKTGTGTLTLSGANTYAGGTTLSAGTLVATGGSALGTGTIANAAALQLDFASDGILANVLSGTGSLTKTGTGAATLTGGGAQGAISVDAGILRFAHRGAFTADSLSTADGATTAIDGHAQLNVANAFTQANGSALNVVLGTNQPVITANNATLAGTLNITGFAATLPDTASALTSTLFTVLHTTNGITGDFSAVDLGGAASTVDYLTLAGRKSADNLDYNVGFGLTWQAGATLGNGVFTLANAAGRFNVDVVLADEAASATGWNGRDLTKAGDGTLTLSAANIYTGLTTVNAGTLAAGIADAFASSSAVSVASGATLAMHDFSQTANNLSGAGTVSLGTLSATTLTANNTSDTAFSGVIGGAGQLSKTGTGTLTLSGTNTYAGGTTLSAGTLIATQGSAMGTGAIANAAALHLDFASDSTLANVLSGTGSLTKTGTGVATLSTPGTQGAVAVNAGTLHFGQSGVFNADSLTTANNATTAVDGNAQLAIANTLTQADGSTLSVALGDSNNPAITAGSATLAGTLNITGFSATAPTTASALTNTLFTVLHTTGGITGDFTTVNLGGASSTVDYLTLAGRRSANNLDYNVGFGLTWQAGATLGNGVFTLAGQSDAFNVDVVLADEAASATGWNGKDLTKAGDGTLTLSAANTYTGLTTVSGGTLAAGIADAFASSSAVSVASGATLALNDFSQTANNLSGAGNINLGQLNTTVLTTHAANDTTFSGVIGGAGQLSKTGTGTLTLSGTSTYTGGTTITDGTLVAANGSAMGTGAIANAAALHLDFASDSTLANTLSGTGSLTKTGAGVATLTGGGAQGAVAVNAGTLRFGQSGVFNADSLATANGATVAIGSDAQIKVANAFTLSSGATLDVLMGKNNNPAIAANSATIGGTLNIGGFAETAPDTASALTNLRFTVLRTTSGITGDFANVSLGSAASPVDYLVVGGRKSADNLEYDVGFGLTWRAGTTRGNGVFTLANATDKFNVDVVLADEAASATKWNGKDLTKNGAGTLTLSAKNTYSGLTVVNAGTLATGIADAFASSSAVAVNSGATLALNDFSQTANNLYGAGKISLGNLASTALTAHNSFDTVFSGVIGGAGQLNKTGAGTMTLLGTNTYGGGTTISDGTLVGSAASFGTGAILNKAALVIDQPSNATLANAINGTGTFTKSGSGVLTLTGNSNLSGPTSVEGGDLVVNGFLGNSAVTMQRGTTLRGNGTVGRTSIVSGARIAPGNSIGTLTVNGAYTQAGGSTFQAQVDPSSTRSDRIHVNGTATLAPGAVLEVSKIAPGEFSVNSNYTVLSATNGVTGTYTLTGDTGGAFYVLKEEYDANNVYLRANRVRNFTDAAGTRNEIATAGALDSMPDSNIIKRAVIALDTDDDARLAFNQLSGEIHASLKTALLGDSRNIRETAIDRIRQRFCAPGFGKDIAASDTAEDNAALETPNDGTCYRRTTRPAGWLRVLGSWGKTAGGNAARLSQDVAGILGGTDTTIGDIWNVGALIGYTHNGMKVDARSSYANSDNFHASIYGGMQRGPLGIRTGAAFAWHNIETHRSPAFPGYTDVLNADYNGRTLQVFGDMGYQLAMRRMNLEPFVNVAVVQTRTNSFKENGGAAALSGDRDHISSTYTTLGLRGSTTIDLPQGAKMTARGMLGWQHTFGTSVPVAGLAFADSNRYTVAGVPQGRNSLVVEAGVDFQISRRASIGVVYSGRVGGSTTTHAVQGRLSIQF